MKSHSEQTPDTKGPESVEPRQWVVVDGQCVPIKQETNDNTDSLAIKQENPDSCVGACSSNSYECRSVVE